LLLILFLGTREVYGAVRSHRAGRTVDCTFRAHFKGTGLGMFT